MKTLIRLAARHLKGTWLFKNHWAPFDNQSGSVFQGEQKSTRDIHIHLIASEEN